MKIAINGTGIAGPTLAYWLKKYGYEPVLFEVAPKLRTGGYLIDFWGTGYDVAEKMKLMPKIKKLGYLMNEFHIVNAKGKTQAKMTFDRLIESLTNRYITISRGDLTQSVFEACEGIETRFGQSIVGVEDKENKVLVELSTGKKEEFDLVIGADGLHSKVRELTFGDMEQFEYAVGFHVVAFHLKDYKAQDDLKYLMFNKPHLCIGRVSLRDNETLFLLIFKDTLASSYPTNEKEEKAMVREVFKNVGWETPHVLKRMEEVENIYYDRVSQIRMPQWSKGRVSLVGDAGYAVSLLAGEGASFAMTGAYILAGELKRANGDHKVAFAEYEKKLAAQVLKKQKQAVSMTGLFAPKSYLHMWVRNLLIRFSSYKPVSKYYIQSMVQDIIELEEY